MNLHGMIVSHIAETDATLTNVTQQYYLWINKVRGCCILESRCNMNSHNDYN